MLCEITILLSFNVKGYSQFKQSSLYCTYISYIVEEATNKFQENLSFPYLTIDIGAFLNTAREFFQFFLLFGIIFYIKSITFRLNLVGLFKSKNLP